MTSEELADAVQDAIDSCRGRILGVGREQYEADNVQRFEVMELNHLAKELIEELDDSIVYVVMMRMRLQNLMKGVEAIVRKESN